MLRKLRETKALQGNFVADSSTRDPDRTNQIAFLPMHETRCTKIAQVCHLVDIGTLIRLTSMPN
jgi:hypothetical protein